MRFDIECPYCSHKMQANPSFLHMWGMLDHGRGECSKCNEVFRLTLILDEEQKPRAMEARVIKYEKLEDY